MSVPRLRPLGRADLHRLDPDRPDDPGALAALERWGLVGVGWCSATDDTDAGHALVCPAYGLPADHPLSRVSTDGAVLVTLHVGDSRLARHLLQGLAARLADHCHRLDAVGSRTSPTEQAPASDLLLGAGFEPVEPITWLPRGAQHLRLDLDRTVRWHLPELPDLAAGMRRWARPEPGVSCRRPAARSGG